MSQNRVEDVGLPNVNLTNNSEPNGLNIDNVNSQINNTADTPDAAEDTQSQTSSEDRSNQLFIKMTEAREKFEALLPNIKFFPSALNDMDKAHKKMWLKRHLLRAEGYLSLWREYRDDFLREIEDPIVRQERTKQSEEQYQIMELDFISASVELQKLSEPTPPPAQQPNPTNNPPSSNQSSNFPAIKFNLKTFTGYNPGEFSSWFAMLNSMVLRNKNYDDAAKIVCIRLHTSGLASSAINHYDVIPENLPLVIAELKNRFDKPEATIDRITNRLSSQPRVPSKNIKALRQFYDSAKAAVTVLKRSEKQLDSTPTLLLSMLKAKLPAEVLDQYVYALATRTADESRPPMLKEEKLTFFFEFLSSYITRKETIEFRDRVTTDYNWDVVKTTNQPPYYNKFNDKNPYVKKYYGNPQNSNQYTNYSKTDSNGVPIPHSLQPKNNPNTVSNFNITSSKTQSRKKCFFCQDTNHLSINCPTARKNAIESFKKAAQHAVCKRCFDHTYKTPCKNNNRLCTICNRSSHHEIVHVPPATLAEHFSKT